MTKVGKRHVDLDPNSPEGLTGKDIYLGDGYGTVSEEFGKLGSVVMLREQYAQGTAGADSIVGWNRRVLNTQVVNSVEGAYHTSGDGSILLPSGTYVVDATGGMHYAGRTTLLLYDLANGITIDFGPSDWMRNISSDTDFATLHSVINIANPTSLTMWQYAATSRGKGMGLPANISGLPEVYATLRLLKVK